MSSSLGGGAIARVGVPTGCGSCPQTDNVARGRPFPMSTIGLVVVIVLVLLFFGFITVGLR
ncbi:MAG: hypothetical protein V4510_06230 [bacterium]